MRRPIFAALAALFVVLVLLGIWWSFFQALAVLTLGLVLLGLYDVRQRQHAVLRNFPVIGHFRYLLEMIRPEINQYFIESNLDGAPFNREDRSLVYQRAKKELDTLPFGTLHDVYGEGYQWIAHSIEAHHLHGDPPRVLVGEATCERPYAASLLNVSAMSFGSLSKNAVLALNQGARLGGFAHNTGEGGISEYHLRPGGDLIWQIGTGYFGCRTPEGAFDPERFRENAGREAVKMIEIKLSQGAKPGHGGILPAAKLTQEIAEIRGVPLGRDVLSPPAHTAFQGPRGLLEFVTRLRELCGKPVGIKLCVGAPHEFLALTKAMRATGLTPDFVTVDGGEGGTGAAPVEFTNSVGMPLEDGLVLVHNALVGFGLRDRVRVFAAGKITSGFHLATKLALGADGCNAARPMMMALGCIQARRCNANDCPVGVATQKPSLVAGLDVEDKARRVASFHQGTLASLMELAGAAGLSSPCELGPEHILRRTSRTSVSSYRDVFEWLSPGDLVEEPVPPSFEAAWRAASPETFAPVSLAGHLRGVPAASRP